MSWERLQHSAVRSLRIGAGSSAADGGQPTDNGSPATNTVTDKIFQEMTGRRCNELYVYPTRCNVTQFILSGNCSTCFGWYHHPSGAQTTVSTASGICHAVTAICRYRGRVGTGLCVLWVAYTFRVVPSPIIRSANNCIYSNWHLSDSYCYLPLSWKS